MKRHILLWAGICCFAYTASHAQTSNSFKLQSITAHAGSIEFSQKGDLLWSDIRSRYSDPMDTMSMSQFANYRLTTRNYEVESRWTNLSGIWYTTIGINYNKYIRKYNSNYHTGHTSYADTSEFYVQAILNSTDTLTGIFKKYTGATTTIKRTILGFSIGTGLQTNPNKSWLLSLGIRINPMISVRSYFQGTGKSYIWYDFHEKNGEVLEYEKTSYSNNYIENQLLNSMLTDIEYSFTYGYIPEIVRIGIKFPLEMRYRPVHSTSGFVSNLNFIARFTPGINVDFGGFGTGNRGSRFTRQLSVGLGYSI